MFYRLKDNIKRGWFNFRCREIIRTPPIRMIKNNVLILSMVSHVDLLMYLIAIKSFYYYLREGQIVVINDGSLTPNDLGTLSYHIPDLRLIDIADIKTGNCPKGGTWERHLFIADNVKHHYIIQLDADTVTYQEMPEVVKCIKDNISFAIGTEPELLVRPMKYTCEKVKPWLSYKWGRDSTQVISESNFCNLINYEKMLYVRCGSSFTGFAKNSFSRKNVESFSQNMESIIGLRWRGWGSEQVTSNFVIANTPGACVLPYPKYASYFLNYGINYENSAFVHFIGINRFKNGLYMQFARYIIKMINKFVK